MDQLAIIEISIAVEQRNFDPASPGFLYDRDGNFFQRPADRNDKARHYTRAEVDRLIELCGWAKCLLLPDNGR